MFGAICKHLLLVFKDSFSTIRTSSIAFHCLTREDRTSCHKTLERWKEARLCFRKIHNNSMAFNVCQVQESIRQKNSRNFHSGRFNADYRSANNAILDSIVDGRPRAIHSLKDWPLARRSTKGNFSRVPDPVTLLNE